MQFTKVNKKFWESRVDYPPFASKARRFYETQYLVPQLRGTSSLLDLGCGDGALLSCLLATTDIQEFHGYDLSKKLLKHVDKRVHTKIYDCLSPTELPKVDVTLMAGLIQYLDEDLDVVRLLDRVQSPTIFVRTTCSPKDEIIITDSKELGTDYASYYRSITHVIWLLEHDYKIEDVRRIYPDEVESTYSSHQYYFKATGK